MRPFQVWWQAFRYHFVPPSLLPAIVGGVLAWAIEGVFHPWYFLLTVIGVTINHLALNMTDDYYDFKNSVDLAKDQEINPYSGGSGTLTSGLIAPEKMLVAFTVGYIVTIVLGVYLSFMRGWTVFAIGVFGMGCAYFYTAPPIRYGYRGLGELSQLVNFSLTIGLGAYYVQAAKFSWEAVLVLLPLGFMMFSMITINEIPDEQQDREAGKMNLVVIFDARTAVWLYGISMAIGYLIILFIPLLGSANFWVYLSLFTLPWFFRAFRIALHHFDDAARLSTANLITIRVHNLTGILLIVAYLIHGALHGSELGMMWVPIVTLAALYLPAALTVFFNIVPLKPATG